MTSKTHGRSGDLYSSCMCLKTSLKKAYFLHVFFWFFILRESIFETMFLKLLANIFSRKKNNSKRAVSPSFVNFSPQIFKKKSLLDSLFSCHWLSFLLVNNIEVAFYFRNKIVLYFFFIFQNTSDFSTFHFMFWVRLHWEGSALGRVAYESRIMPVSRWKHFMKFCWVNYKQKIARSRGQFGI